MIRYYADIGNSRVKVAEWQSGNWNMISECTHKEILVCFSELLLSSKEVKIILSSVRTDLLKRLESKFGAHFFEVLSKNSIPGKLINYDTPETLGLDRFLSTLGAHKIAKDSVIVVDAGTAITVDLMNKDGIYQGGVIMPGLQPLRRSIIELLPELPDFPDTIPDVWPGKSTKESIQWGTTGMVSYALKAYIESHIQLLDKQPKIILTGGDAKWVGSLLDGTFKFQIHPFLLFDGMRAMANLKE